MRGAHDNMVEPQPEAEQSDPVRGRWLLRTFSGQLVAVVKARNVFHAARIVSRERAMTHDDVLAELDRGGMRLEAMVDLPVWE